MSNSTPHSDPGGNWWDWPVGIVCTLLMFALLRWAFLAWLGG